MHGAYAFETFKGQKACAVYVSIFNNTEIDFEISSLSSNVSGRAEIHGIFMDNEIVKMKKITNLTIKSKDQVYLQPGGMHIMLMDLKEELVDGTSFTIDFLINNQDIMTTDVMVVSNKLRENIIE
tara:strand:+ start:601 stop:975 length:375 start_codon:yes stop_codon:yes gene_type:complete